MAVSSWPCPPPSWTSMEHACDYASMTPKTSSKSGSSGAQKKAAALTAARIQVPRPAYRSRIVFKKCRGLKKEGGNLLRGVPPTKEPGQLFTESKPCGTTRATVFSPSAIASTKSIERYRETRARVIKRFFSRLKRVASDAAKCSD